ncbi:hypothetical protein [Pseudoalteromonas luteoviolacea]|uniref:hypothetical protein n=1 Tax=Pseudoalteromonas luteoviolacea TaxID=43657 RepID=UPI001B3870CB|nr:hypothetical protein [Pseudoalteromonas luteoviolacea]MBQ4837794.1 hypothetical protein [Pseudoalteromonas luteoviolacea]
MIYSVLIYLTAVASSSVDVDHAYLHQLPTQCDNYTQLANQGYRILPCFFATLGNNRTNQSVIRDAYRQFHALNWDVLEGLPGVADYRSNYLSKRDTYPVWQSWPNLNSFSKLDDTSWQKAKKEIPDICHDFVSFQDRALFEKNHPNITNLNTPLLLETLLNPQGNILIDSNGNPVYYSIHMNKVAFDYLKDNETADPKIFPAADAYANKRGSIFVKAAWLISSFSDAENYHRAAAFIVEKEQQQVTNCKLAVVSLSALHIINKNNPTPQALAPADTSYKLNMWSWATYLHSGAVPTKQQNSKSEVDLNSKYPLFSERFITIKESCYDRSGNLNTQLPTCKINKPTCYSNASGCEPSALLGLLSNEDKDILTIYNAKTAELLKSSVWGNYRILNSQWSDMGIIKPKYLANPILEPFDGLDSSCSGCHSDANTQKFNDFVFSTNLKLN